MDIGISISQYSFLPIIIYSVPNNYYKKKDKIIHCNPVQGRTGGEQVLKTDSLQCKKNENLGTGNICFYNWDQVCSVFDN